MVSGRKYCLVRASRMPFDILRSFLNNVINYWEKNVRKTGIFSIL